MMRCHTVMKSRAPVVAIGLVLVSLSLAGHIEVGWASTDSGPLQIEHERVSGTVTDVRLQRLLDQFHEQLGIDYQASKEELAKLVSVDLHQASIQQAVEKILATWDYALTRDQAGRIRHIFVLPKVLAGGMEEETIQAAAERSRTAHSRRGRQHASQSSGEPSVALRETRSESFASSSTLRPDPLDAAPQRAKENEDHENLMPKVSQILKSPRHVRFRRDSCR